MNSYIYPIALACMIAVATLSHSQVSNIEKASASSSGSSIEYLPSVQSADILSLGHQSALADVFWIRGVLYFHNQIVGYKSFQWLQQYVDLVSELDPDFADIYRWGGGVMIYSRKEVRFEDVQAANAVLEKGAERFPNNYRLPLSAAANCSYYVKNPSDEEKLMLRSCRRRFIAMAAKRPGVPDYAVLLYVQTVAEEKEESADVKQSLCEFLVKAYMSNGDIALQRQIERKMRGGFCGETMSAEGLMALRKRFEAIHEKHMAYIPPDMAVHVVDFKQFED